MQAVTKIKTTRKIKPGASKNKLPLEIPGFIEPMKAKLTDQLPEGEQWVYEVKFDGIRALAVKNGKKVVLLSRNKKELNERFPSIVEAIKNLPMKSGVLDGEVVALDESGRSSFQLLQSQNLVETAPELFFYAFDILNLDGRATRQLPLPERKELLRSVVPASELTTRYSPMIPGDAKTIIKQMRGLGLEGIIAKRSDSTYEAGSRSGSWRKFKWTNEQEFIIGGYSDPEGAREFFGAILVGYYKEGKLLFASKVGTGFNGKWLAALFEKFKTRSRTDCPFANLPEPRTLAGRQGLTFSEMKKCHWIDPELVCQIRFTEWTRDDHLRHPVFIGLREDKSAREVTREIPEKAE